MLPTRCSYQHTDLVLVLSAHRLQLAAQVFQLRVLRLQAGLSLHKEEEEGHVLFNDALNTFYLRLYGVGHMVKDHSDSE